MHNPSRIKKLQHVVSIEWIDVRDQSPMNYPAQIFYIDS